MKKEIILTIFLILGTVNTVYAEQLTYEIEIDDNEYVIDYEVNADVLAMAIDQEAKSLLVGLDHTKDSEMNIGFEKNILDAENGEFAVLVNGLEIEYEIISDSTFHTLTFYVPTDTEEVEIIGTHVIPEFPVNLIIIVGFMMMISIVFSHKLRRNFI